MEIEFFKEDSVALLRVGDDLRIGDDLIIRIEGFIEPVIAKIIRRPPRAHVLDADFHRRRQIADDVAVSGNVFICRTDVPAGLVLHFAIADFADHAVRLGNGIFIPDPAEVGLLELDDDHGG